MNKKWKPKKVKRRKAKVKVFDTKKPSRNEIAPHLEEIAEAVEKAGGDVGKDTTLGILLQGKENYEETLKEADRRNRS